MQFHRSFRCPEYRTLPVFTLKQQYLCNASVELLADPPRTNPETDARASGGCTEMTRFFALPNWSKSQEPSWAFKEGTEMISRPSFLRASFSSSKAGYSFAAASRERLSFQILS